MEFLIELYPGRCQVSAISHPATKATCAMTPTAPQASMCLAVPVSASGMATPCSAACSGISFAVLALRVTWRSGSRVLRSPATRTPGFPGEQLQGLPGQ